MCVIVSCPFPFHFIFCGVCCCALCYLSLEVARDRQVPTLHHIHLSLQNSPSYSTNVSLIRRHHRSPLYIILVLVGIPTNDIVNIVVIAISETLHWKNREGFFQLERQFFNKK